MINLAIVPEKRLRRVETLLSENRFEDVTDLAEESSFQFDSTLIRKLFGYAIELHAQRPEDWKSKLDAYLAPRVHAALRIPPSMAAAPGLWTWLSVTYLREYVELRWPKKEEGSWWRYNSKDLLRNAISRLWWGAEMVRSGPSYDLVPHAFRSVRAFQNVSELRYSWHRECARAFTEVLRDHQDNGDALGPLLNAYLKTHSLERFDLVDPITGTADVDTEWLNAKAEWSELTGPVIDLKGPRDGEARPRVQESLRQWLEQLYHRVQR